jgi:hypothetical protein
MTEQHKCCGKVGNGFSFFRCDRNAKYEHLGKWYCKTHHPPTVWAKREARSAEWNKEFEARQLAIKEVQAAKDEAARRAALYPELLEALKAMLENGQDYTATRDKARAAIARAEGEKT